MKITIHDYVHCEADKELKQHVYDCLSYPSEYWKQGPFSKKKVNSTSSFLDKRNGLFYFGFLERVKEYLITKKIKYEIKINEQILNTPEIKKNKPSIKGITFFPDQIDLITKAIEKERGMIVSPTGTGKSILAIGIMSCYPSAKILFLCHNLSILTQFKKDLEGFGYNKEVSFMGGGVEVDNSKRILVASIASFAKLDPELWMDKFDCVIIDEVHRIGKRTSQYSQVMGHSLAQIKIGFTATMPKEKEISLNIEGLLGPIIGEYKLNDAADDGRLVKPKITLIPVKWDERFDMTKTNSYRKIYLEYVVNNKARNRKIIMETRKRIKEGQTVLIFVKEIEHGKILEKMFKGVKLDKKVKFVNGSTKIDVRETVKQALNSKIIKGVIVTVVWKEGVNIPTLNTIINAHGGKSFIEVLQVIGRGTRVAEGKEYLEVIDMVDPYKYLAQHFVQRLQIYIENGWI